MKAKILSVDDEEQLRFLVKTVLDLGSRGENWCPGKDLNLQPID
jgi:hypothetical protein